MKVVFHNVVKSRKLLFIVIISRYNGKWVLVRHHTRKTWEHPGGHIEPGESADAAAERELIEETSALSFDLTTICDFTVETKEKSSKNEFSRLYFAEIYELGKFGGFEIEEIMLCDDIPKNLTYKQIQPYLFEKVKKEIDLNMN